MKVGIVTFIHTVNFGASLQAYALQETIRSYGFDAEIIQYVNEEIEKKEKNQGQHSLKGLIKKFVMEKGIKNKIQAFQQFEEKYLVNGMELVPANYDLINQHYDYFITGSDQVWNMKITHFDWTYFLEFVQDQTKKISYAPSFGNSVFPEDAYRKAAEAFSTFHALSVREKSGADLIKKLTGRNAQVVVDPTLLLNRKEWAERTDFKPDIQKYILVYFPHNQKKVFDFVEELSQKTGLPVVYLSISPRKQRGTKTIYDASPSEFLGWIFNAEYVVTGSFHGTAFSLNFEKQFFYEPSGEGSRIDNLVKLTGTESRSIENKDAMNKRIDYSIVSKIVDQERNVSAEWLKAALKEG